MREFKYTPDICLEKEELDAHSGEMKKIPAKYQGHVVIMVPDAVEKLELLEEMGLEYNDKGELKGMESKVGLLKKLLLIAKKNIKQIDLTDLSSGDKITDVDELYYDPDLTATITEIANKIVQGVKISKNLKPA